MKKLVATMLVVASILCLSSVYAEEPVITITSASEKTASPDYRNSYWGMTYDEVKESEESVTWEDPINMGTISICYYLGTTADMDSTVSFSFNNGKLQRGLIAFSENHSNENLYIDDYNTLKQKLIDKYGAATDSGIVWSDDLYKDDPSEYGFAVSRGDLKYLTVWETSSTRISLVLFGDNYECMLNILYEDLNNPYNADDTGDNGL